MTRRNFITSSAVATAAIACGLKASAPVTLKIQHTKPEIQGVDLPLLLECIALVESGGDDTKVSRTGDRSRYQISEVVWKQHTRYFTQRHFKACCKGDAALGVASVHIAWLDANLPRGGILETRQREFPLAWCWRYGLDSWSNPAPYAHLWRDSDYASRVTNLYRERTGRT